MLRPSGSTSCARRFRGDGPSTPIFSRSRIAGFDCIFSLCDLCLSFLVMDADNFTPNRRREAGPITTPNKNGSIDLRPLEQSGTDRNLRIRMPAAA
jgi:hypothetical protein